MVDRIILVCCALFLPLGLLIASKLIDRTTIKEKDRTISDLTSKMAGAVSSRIKAEKSQQASEAVAGVVSDTAMSSVQNASEKADLMADAKTVKDVDDALDLARRQVEVNRR